MSKLVSIVSPMFNEEESVKLFYDKLIEVLKSTNYRYEIIFVNDGSLDNTQSIISEICKLDKSVKSIELSRNFGTQVATSAGIDHARGDAVINLDSDFQHPVSLIPELLIKWESGTDIVLTKRNNFTHSFFAKLFFWLNSKITKLELNYDISDYRLLDKKVAKQLANFSEKQRFLRGMISWVGFKKEYVSFDVEDRLFGESKFNFKELIKLGFTGIKSFSYWPLKFSLIMGTIIMFISIMLLAYMLIDFYITHSLGIRPIAFFVVLNSFMLGIVLVSIGFMAEYIETIHVQSLGRPLYVIRSKYNFLEDKNE